MKGYYSLGLCGYEIVINDDNESVTWTFITDTKTNEKEHRAKINYTNSGRAYFKAGSRRIYLDTVLRI